MTLWVEQTRDDNEHKDDDLENAQTLSEASAIYLKTKRGYAHS